MFWSLKLCSTVWSQVAWFFQLHFPFWESWNISEHFVFGKKTVQSCSWNVIHGFWYQFQCVCVCVCVCVCRVGSDLYNHQAILGHQLGIQFDSILTLYVEIASDCTGYPCYLTAVRSLPCQILNRKSRYFWPTGYALKVPTTSLLGPIHLLEWLTELRETCHLPDYWFGVKGCDSGRSRMKEMGQCAGKGCTLSVSSPAGANIPSYDVLTKPDMLQTPSSWF